MEVFTVRKVLKVGVALAVVTSVNYLLGTDKQVHASENQEELDKMKVMSFNLRNSGGNDPSPHSWSERRPTVQSFLETEEPDILGTQEALYDQVTHLDEDLPDYEWIGIGREGGTDGEFMAIYYKSDRFKPTDTGHYWLSDTPDVVGSTSWGNTISRMVTWAKFEEEATGEQFYVVNTHFDHQSEESRQKSAELIIEKINEYDENLPIILTGDFNTTPDSVSHGILTGEGLFEDPWNYAEEKINEELGTFNGFNDPTGGGTDNKIDWVLTKNIFAESIGINDYRNGEQYPSDHFPVIAEFKLGEE